MIQILEYTEGRIIAAKASKKITISDYYKLLPLFVNRLKQYPNIRLYLEIAELRGLELDGLREEIGFNTGLASTFDKVALLGQKTKEQWHDDLLKPFTSAEIKWFAPSKMDEAMKWLKANHRKMAEPLIANTHPATHYALSGN